MLTARVVQEAGRGVPLDAGRDYELADVVGEALVRAGAATPVLHTAVHDAPAAEPKRRARR